MKKNLLTLVALLTAMTATAQRNVQGLSKFENANLAKIAVLDKEIGVNQSAKTTTLKKVKAKAEDNDNVAAVFIQTSKGEVVADFTLCAIDTLWKANQQIEVVVDEEGNTETVDCNVCIKDRFGGYRLTETVYGVYGEDEEGQYLYFPGEQLALQLDGKTQTGTEYHYDIYMMNYTETEEGFSVGGWSFTGEDGILYSEGDGWCLLYTDRSTGETLGVGGTCEEATLMKENGTASYWYRTSNGTYEYNDPCHIEDLEYQVAVNGWMNTKLVMDIEDDMTVKIHTGAPIYDEILAAADGYAWDAGMIVLRGWKLEDGEDEEGPYQYYALDIDADYIYGELNGNTITVPFIMTSSENSGTGEYEGYWYSLLGIRENTFTLNDGAFAAGIQDVNMTREEKIKNTKTFNLMGQQVNRANVKGIVIRDGKKLMIK